MAFLGKLRSQRHYNLATSRFQSLSRGKSSSPTEDLDFCVINFRKAIELNDGFAEAHHNLGHVFILGAEYNEALSGIRDISPEQTQQINSFNQDAYSDAVEAVEKAIRLRYQFPEAHNTLGKALIRLGRYDEALHEFEISLEQSPNYTTAIENQEKLRRLLSLRDEGE